MDNTEFVSWYYTTCNEVFATKDPDLMRAWMDATADDLIYQNKPLDVVHGKQRFLTDWVAALSENCEFMNITVHHTAADGEWVMNKRYEEWRINAVTFGGDIMGLIRVRDGKIAELYDYMPHFQGWRDSGQMPDEFFVKFGAPPR